jgi:hypothetical protein
MAKLPVALSIGRGRGELTRQRVRVLVQSLGTPDESPLDAIQDAAAGEPLRGSLDRGEPSARAADNFEPLGRRGAIGVAHHATLVKSETRLLFRVKSESEAAQIFASLFDGRDGRDGALQAARGSRAAIIRP